MNSRDQDRQLVSRPLCRRWTPVLFGAVLAMAHTSISLAASQSPAVYPRNAAPLPQVPAESLGLNSSRLARIGEHFAGEVAKETAAGYVIVVARNGKLAYASAVGQRDREAGLPMTLDTRFRIASMTKPVTATAVLMLYEEAKLHLDDPIARYLPEFKDMQVAVGLDEAGNLKTEPARRPITVRHVLTHSAGFGYGPLFDGNSPAAKAWAKLTLSSGDTLAAKTRDIAQLPLNFHPGEGWRYSVSNDVLGRLVEVVAGQPFDEFLQQRLFTPLGMRHTGFWVPPGDLPWVAKAYRRGESGKLELGEFPPLAVQTQRPSLISGGGGLISTAGDYLRFAQMLANGGTFEGRQYLSPVTVALMASNQVAEDAQQKFWGGSSRGLGYGLGVAPQFDFRLAPHAATNGDFNWGGILDTHWFASPETGVVAVLMTAVNPMGRKEPARTDADFRALVYAAIQRL
ncbi:MAG: serine hydrolase domain-containing protein [Gammaproteobacteria bacterium]